MKAKVMYVVIDGEVTGGNMVCLRLLEETLRRGWQACLVSPADGPFCDMVRHRGVSVYYIDTRRSYHVAAAASIANVVRAEQVSLIHAHAPFAGTVLSRLAGRLARVPVITHAHVQDTFNTNPVIRGYQLALNRYTSSNCCAAVIAVSEQVRNESIKQGVDGRKIRVIYNGVDSSIWQGGDSTMARMAVGVAGDRPIVAHIGRLCESKGQHVLIEAAHILRQAGHDVLFWLIGDDLGAGGNYRRKLEGQVRALGLQDSVIFLGRRGDIPKLLAATTMLVLPSTIEGFPIVLLEAMAAGVPVIATPVGGVPELVVDGETGRLIPVEDPESLALAILDYLRHPEEAAKTAARALAAIQERFTLKAMLEQTFAVYDRVLSR